MKNLTILGSTGSIGTQALDVIREKKGQYNVIALSANSNIETILKQYKEFKPKYISINDYNSYTKLKDILKSESVNILYGIEGLIEISTLKEVDMVLTSIMGMIGLRPTIEAIKNNKDIALANKETLVVGGEIIKNLLKKVHLQLIIY